MVPVRYGTHKQALAPRAGRSPDPTRTHARTQSVGKVNKVWDVFTHHLAEEVGHIWKAINPYDLVPKKKAYW